MSVDPLTSSYPWYTPYQFAGNKPIAAVDLDGLEEQIKVVAEINNNSPKISISTEVADNMVKAYDAITTIAEEFVNQYPLTPSLNQKIVNLARISPLIQSLQLYDKSGKVTTKKEILGFNQQLSGFIIGEMVSFYNPFLGLAVGTLLDDASKEDGLTKVMEEWLQHIVQVLMQHITIHYKLKGEKKLKNLKIL